MIEDEEFRRIFGAEIEDRLARVEAALLALEQGEAPEEHASTMQREVHSIKGSARLLGLGPIERVAHAFEDVLARSGTRKPTPELAQAAYAAIDALRALAAHAVTGAGPPIDAESVLARLEGGRSTRVPRREMDAPSAPRGHDVVRVRPESLDALLEHGGELGVVAQRAAQRLHDLDELEALTEPAGTPRGLDAVQLARIHDLASRMRRTAQDEEAELARIAREMNQLVHDARLVPVESIFAPFPRMVRDIALEQGKDARLVYEAAGASLDRRVVDELKDPLVHLIRNAIDHGLEDPPERAAAGKTAPGTISLTARRLPSATVIEVSDDGRGIDVERVRLAAQQKGLVSAERAAELRHEQVLDLVFERGFSTKPDVTSVSGRGVGLDAVRTTIERLKGRVEIETTTGRGTTFRMRLPHTIALDRVIVARARGHLYGIADDAIESVRLVAPEHTFASAGRRAIGHEGQPIPIAALGDVLRVPPPADEEPPRSCLILRSPHGRVGILADELITEQEILVRARPPLLRLRLVSGAAILPAGDLCLLLNPHELARVALEEAPGAQQPSARREARRLAVLLVEDSITTRTQEKRILEGAGFEVVLAVDGLDALIKLQTRKVDAVVTDLEMPRMDGFALTERIRADRRLRDLPVILVTSSASPDDRQRGAEAGADAYITKGDFDEETLLATLRRLVA